MSCDLCAEPAAAEWLTALDPDSDEQIVDVLAHANDGPLDEVLSVRPGDRISDACVECALAAAEVVATCAGAHADEPPPLVLGYAEDCGVPSDELLASAFQAVQRVALEPELRDVEVVDLEQRLASVAA